MELARDHKEGDVLPSQCACISYVLNLITQWVLEVLDPFLAKQRAAAMPPLPEDEKALLLIDVWPVHIAKKSPDDFLPWLKATHKNIIVIFVPGGCAYFVYPI